MKKYTVDCPQELFSIIYMTDFLPYELVADGTQTVITVDDSEDAYTESIISTSGYAYTREEV